MDIVSHTKGIVLLQSLGNDSGPSHETKNGELKGTPNYDHNRVFTAIHNARGHEEHFKVSVHGFSLYWGLVMKHIDLIS